MASTVIRYGAGEAPDTWIPGDFLLCSNPAPWRSKAGFVSAAIRFGQRLRYRGDRVRYAHWNHAVCVCDGHLVEALGHGVVASPYDAYTPAEYDYVHTELTDAQRADFAAFVDSQIGDPYGYLTILSIAFRLLTGLHIGLSRVGHVICSGLCAAALGTYKWRTDPAFVMPADLAQEYDVGGSNG